MQDVVSMGTGTACQLENMSVAGKTGTTDAYNDLWFVGFTPYYTCAVWSGYDNNEKLPDAAREFHKNLWRKVMTRIHQDLPNKEFEVPASVIQGTVCSETGMLPTIYCPSITEYFDTDTYPEMYCDLHNYLYYQPSVYTTTVAPTEAPVVTYEQPTYTDPNAYTDPGGGAAAASGDIVFY